MTRTAITGAGAIVSVLVGLTGCQSAPSSPRDAWGQYVLAMGMAPLAPVSEDIRVGDVYAYAMDPTISSLSHAQKPWGSRWSSVPVLAALDTEYRGRPAWPKTPDQYLDIPEKTDDRSWPEPSSPTIFADDPNPNRLRIVATNALKSISVSAGDLEPFVPTEASAMISGPANDKSIAISLRVGSAENYSLPLDTLLSLLADEVPGDGATRKYLKEEYRSNLSLMGNPGTNRVWLRVISEVLYIRSADISVRALEGTPKDDQVTVEQLATASQVAATDSTSTASQPQSQPPADPQAQTQDPAQGQPPAQDQQAQSTQTSSQSGLSDNKKTAAAIVDPIYGSFYRAAAINEILVKTDTDDLPTGTVRFISVTDESVVLRRVWTRGLAVAVRGMTIEVDTTTGEVIRVGRLAGPARSSAPRTSP